MGLDVASVIVIHTAMMLAFSLLFAGIYFVDRDWRFPWHFSIGFLLAPSVMVLPGLGERHGLPALREIGVITGFVGPALITMGAARLMGLPLHRARWIAAFAAFALLHLAVGLGGYGMLGHLVILNGAIAGFALAFILIARHLPAEDHPLGRPVFLWTATGTAIVHILRVPAIALGWDGAGSSDTISVTMIIGMTIITAFIATSIIILVAERFAAKIRREARTDTLTGLALRRVFDDQLRAELERWKRHQRPFAVILFDIDHFKQVNDAHGHDVGDVALRLVADCGRAILRPNDLLARLGGDEFALVLPESSLGDAIQVAERILAALRTTPLTTPRGELRLTGSFGVAAADMPDETAESIVKRADEALYAVKRRGRNGVAGLEQSFDMEEALSPA